MPQVGSGRREKGLEQGPIKNSRCLRVSRGRGREQKVRLQRNCQRGQKLTRIKKSVIKQETWKFQERKNQ